jgi:hypothetical protein
MTCGNGRSRGADLCEWAFGCFTPVPVDTAGSPRKVPGGLPLLMAAHPPTSILGKAKAETCREAESHPPLCSVSIHELSRNGLGLPCQNVRAVARRVRPRSLTSRSRSLAGSAHAHGAVARGVDVGRLSVHRGPVPPPTQSPTRRPRRRKKSSTAASGRPGTPGIDPGSPVPARSPSGHFPQELQRMQHLGLARCVRAAITVSGPSGWLVSLSVRKFRTVRPSVRWFTLAPIVERPCAHAWSANCSARGGRP